MGPKLEKKSLMLNTLRPVTKRHRKKRLGRGDGSGHGGTATKGHKGQNARTGTGGKRGFEGGQMPLVRRLPKRGFTNIFRKEIGIVNLDRLAILPAGTEVNLELAKQKGWVSSKTKLLKILGDGDLKQALKIKANRVSESAKTKIEKSGSTLELL